MKICFFAATLTKGGAERVISNLSNFLINHREIEKVDIITVFNSDIAYELDKKINVYTIDKEYKEYKNLVNSGTKLKRFIFKVKKYFQNIKRKIILKKMIRSFDYDVIISFLPEPSFLILSLKKLIKCPIIVSDRNDPNIEYKGIRKNYLMKKLYPMADGFIFQTKDAQNYFENIIHKEYEIIANPVNDDFIVNSYVGEREKNIITVGRLEEQKNHLMLIKAFEKIRDKYKNYKLIIYGEGSLKTQLQDYISKNNLDNQIVLAGQIDNVKDKIYKDSLFVLSSNYEGMPNALIEAMCLGLPVISTDCPCGGPRSLINNKENGILVATGDEDEMSKAIDIVLSNKELSVKIAQNASKLSNEVSSEVINNKWLNFIKKIVKESK